MVLYKGCNHSYEGYSALLRCGTVHSSVQGVLAFKSVDEILKCNHS